MAVFRIEKTRDYTVMANHHLRNTALSLKAKGLLSLMLSLPEDWDYTTKGLARICRDGVDSICATVRELEDAGYINPTYSAGNIALVMFQDPEATVFGTAERWKTLNRGVIDQERSKGVKIFARNTLGRGYRLTDAYDIRQTQGRDLKKVQLKDDSKEMSIALRAILNYSVVPVATDHDLPVAAYYDSKNMELAVNPAFSDSEAFAAIAAEVAHSRIHAKGANPNYDHEEVDLDAQSISYILCRQFGIKRDTPDLSRLEELYEGWDPQQRRSALDQIQGMSKQFGGSIERNITPQQRSRIPPQRQSR